jgi:hypothetical protein
MTELKLDLAVDSRQAVRGIDDIADALDDVAGEFRDTADNADRQLGDIEDSLRQLSKVAKQEGKDAGKGLSKGVKSGADDAKSEIASSGREAAASFSGGFDDITGFVQESLANAFAGFGPGGAGLGLLAAAGVGIATALFGQAQEEAEKTAERVEDAYQRMLDAKATFVTDALVKDAILDQSAEDRRRADDIATQAGVDASVVRRALAGDEVAQQELLVALADKKKDAEDRAAKALRDGSRQGAAGIDNQVAAIDNLIGEIEDAGGAWRTAAGDVRATQRAVEDVGSSATESERRAQGIAQGYGAAFAQVRQGAASAKREVEKLPDRVPINAHVYLDKSSVDDYAASTKRNPIQLQGVLKVPHIVVGGRQIL